MFVSISFEVVLSNIVLVWILIEHLGRKIVYFSSFNQNVKHFSVALLGLSYYCQLLICGVHVSL